MNTNQANEAFDDCHWKGNTLPLTGIRAATGLTAQEESEMHSLATLQGRRDYPLSQEQFDRLRELRVKKWAGISPFKEETSKVQIESSSANDKRTKLFIR